MKAKPSPFALQLSTTKPNLFTINHWMASNNQKLLYADTPNDNGESCCKDGEESRKKPECRWGIDHKLIDYSGTNLAVKREREASEDD